MKDCLSSPALSSSAKFQDGEMVAIGKSCSLRSFDSSGNNCIIVCLCWYSTKNVKNVRRRHKSFKYLSWLCTDRNDVISDKTSGFLGSPRQSLRLATLLRLLTVNLE